jgi:predicted 3-demethylubiquinone-9 3-methyltransferase (glyoxalase superfamily)
MEKVFFNILWIDDEHETLTGTKGRAKRNGINLIPFKSLNAGMDELERNYPFYDGILLDAKFFENEDDAKGTEDTYNVHRAKERLLQLKKKFEVFILTGQAEAYEDKTFKKAFTKVYKKGSDEEIDRLFSNIKEAAVTQVDTQIRHSYKRVFEVCTEKYIGELAGQDILNLL